MRPVPEPPLVAAYGIRWVENGTVPMIRMADGEEVCGLCGKYAASSHFESQRHRTNASWSASTETQAQVLERLRRYYKFII